MSIAHSTDQHVLLVDVSWETYQDLRQQPANRHVRMTFDRGRLELMSPSKNHERLAYLIGRLIDVWTEERRIPIQSCRSTTFQREDLDHGLEPDNCYYVANESQVRGRDDFDSSTDPPPDLAIEVDITSSSIDRMPLYASLGVREVWRYEREQIEIHLLQADGVYAAGRTSRAFPDLSIEACEDALDRRNETDETTLIRSFRKYVQGLP